MKIKKLGIVVERLNFCQFGVELIRNLNILCHKSIGTDIIVFREETEPLPMTPNFAIMHIKELWRFDGWAISTSIPTTQKLISAACPRRKFFYLWQLEWLYNSEISFDFLSKVYTHPDIELLTRSKAEFDIIERIWRRPNSILEDFSHEQLLELLGGTAPNTSKNPKSPTRNRKQVVA